MTKEERAAEIRREIETLKAELKTVTGESTLDLKNRNKLKYPYVSGGRTRPAEVFEGALNINSLSIITRLMLAPTAVKQQTGRHQGNYSTRAKKVRELTPEEYRAVCECIDEIIDVLDKHNRRLHPHGIAGGDYREGQSLYVTEEDETK